MTTKTIEFKLVDAFAMSSYSGNVAGVVLDADGLSDRQMQHIAAEFNASETAFVLPATTREAALRLRWFTPGCEVGFCGHATLGAVHALLESERIGAEVLKPDAVLNVECKKGLLAIRIERSNSADRPATIWLDMPNPQPKSRNVFVPVVADRLGLQVSAVDTTIPPILTNDDDLIIAVKELQTLMELQPPMTQLAKYCAKDGVRGILVTTRNALSQATAVQSRFFAPATGIDEDPVTGSAHGPLGLHLVECGVVPMVNGKADFFCAQAKAGGRAGVVRVVVMESPNGEKSVRIGGSCVTTASGTLTCLPKD
jgi:trans-2,3-dihydro-3-hydroxyanthranilate isomerase